MFIDNITGYDHWSNILSVFGMKDEGEGKINPIGS